MRIIEGVVRLVAPFIVCVSALHFVVGAVSAKTNHIPPTPSPSPTFMIQPEAVAPSQPLSPPAPTEAQMRRRLVPYIFAASNCVARATRSDFEFRLAVTTDNYRASIDRAIGVCSQPLATMAQTYDSIYGAGGAQFLSGAYATDLERAVRKLLATDIASERRAAQKDENDRRAAEARALTDRLAAESRAAVAQKEKVALLEKSRDLIRTKMLDCLSREGASMLLTDEKAEVVAKASMILCQADVDALVRSSMEIEQSERGGVAELSGLSAAIENRVHDTVTAYFIKARGDLIGRSLKASAPSPQIAPSLPPT